MKRRERVQGLQGGSFEALQELGFTCESIDPFQVTGSLENGETSAKLVLVHGLAWVWVECGNETLLKPAMGRYRLLLLLVFPYVPAYVSLNPSGFASLRVSALV